MPWRGHRKERLGSILANRERERKRVCVCVCVSHSLFSLTLLSHSSLSLFSLSLSSRPFKRETENNIVVTRGLTGSEGQVAVDCATRSSTSVLGRMAEIAEVLSLLISFFLKGGKLEVFAINNSLFEL